MRIFVNGDAHETTTRDVTALIAELNQHPQATLVEHNGVALRPDEWSAATLHEGDRIELLRVVAGG